MMLPCTKVSVRAGAVVVWFAAHTRLTTLRDYLCTRVCVRAGAVVRWFAAHTRLTTLRD
jgi:hypothetical protein